MISDKIAKLIERIKTRAWQLGAGMNPVNPDLLNAESELVTELDHLTALAALVVKADGTDGVLVEALEATSQRLRDLDAQTGSYSDPDLGLCYMLEANERLIAEARRVMDGGK